MTKETYQSVVKFLKEEIKSLTIAQINRKSNFKQAQRDLNQQEIWNLDPTSYKETLTAIHILYNEVRNRPGHTSDDSMYKRDCRYKCMFDYYMMKIVKEKAYDTKGIEVVEIAS